MNGFAFFTRPGLFTLIFLFVIGGPGCSGGRKIVISPQSAEQPARVEQRAGISPDEPGRWREVGTTRDGSAVRIDESSVVFSAETTARVNAEISAGQHVYENTLEFDCQEKTFLIIGDTDGSNPPRSVTEGTPSKLVFDSVCGREN